MAGTLLALLVLVTSFLTGLIPLAAADSQSDSSFVCLGMDNCFKQFNDKATYIHHDMEIFCELMKKRLSCYDAVFLRCPEHTKSYAQSTIKNANTENENMCDASGLMSSFTVLSVGFVVSVIFHRLL